MQMKFRLLLFIGMVSTAALRGQQPAQYTTYMLDPFRINPAYAGLDYGLSATGVYRQQWAGLQGAPRGVRVGVHLPLYIARGGIGVQAEQDDIGAHRLSRAQLAYNYQMDMAGGVLALGISGTFQQWTLNGNELRTPDGAYTEPGSFSHNDDLLGLLAESGGTVAVGAGAFFQGDRLSVGISAENLNAPSATLPLLVYPFSRNYHIYAAYSIEAGRELVVQPSLWFRTDAIENQLDLSVTATYKDNILLGTSYRGYSTPTQDAVVLLFGFRLSPALRMVYAHDIGLSALKDAHSGSHEVAIRYFLNTSIGKGKPPRIIYHPRMKQ